MKAPVLMYHEVSEGPTESSEYKMTPIYNLPKEKFEAQIKFLFENGYRSICFEDIAELDPKGKEIIITFDDGLIGNIRCALPILVKYGFKGVFFVATGSIGQPGFMSWTDLQNLLGYGMAVQSHTRSHHPLQALKDFEIVAELSESKRALEEKLKINVNSISFPHGSFNRSIVKMAEDAGYKFMCTSNPVFSHRPNPGETVVFGRITISTKVNMEKFRKLISLDKKEILKEQMKKKIKNTVKKIVGIQNYRKLYRAFFNIKP